MRGRLARWRGSGWLRRIALALAVIVALPLVLTLVYAVPFMRPVSNLMLADLLTLQGYDRRWVPLEAMGKPVVHAVVMSEDGQFCSHHGVDLREMSAVLEDAMSGSAARGASTIPMQTVKNLFLWNGRSYVRKALELPLAIYLDLVLSKPRIMEIYLNIAEFGPGIYGVEAAAQHYFRKPASELNRRQAALIAVTLPSPLTRNPARPSAGLNRLAGTVIARAERAGAYVACLD